VADRPGVASGAFEIIPEIAPPMIEVYKPASGRSPIAVANAIP
jgi:hypothetical protein